MKTKALILVSLLLIVLAISTMNPVAAKQPPYKQTNLVSNVSGKAQITDPNLVNSWGLARSRTGPWFVADNGMGVSTTYNGNGKILPLKITIPAINGNSASSPTGVVFNSGTDFTIAKGKPAQYIFVTEDGTISGWNPTVDSKNAVQKVNNSPGAVYKGVTIAKNWNRNLLYVANFRGGTVDVFDTNFNKVKLGANKFKDDNIPTGFAPFNVQNINSKIYVSYAKQDAAKHDNLDGPGLGYVDVFNPDGTLVKRLQHGPWMNAPWGITKAPRNFGIFSNNILIGNFGSGNIAAFDPKTEKFNGLLSDSSGLITIDGLWGLKFGNGELAGPTNTLFFAAGLNGEADGLFGTITTTDNKFVSRDDD